MINRAGSSDSILGGPHTLLCPTANNLKPPRKLVCSQLYAQVNDDIKKSKKKSEDVFAQEEASASALCSSG